MIMPEEQSTVDKIQKHGYVNGRTSRVAGILFRNARGYAPSWFFFALSRLSDLLNPYKETPWISRAFLCHLTWLAKHLLNEFAEAAGYRTKLARLDPIRTASRLDKPVGESGSVLGDFVPDPSQSTERVDEDVWQEQLAAAMLSLLEELGEDQRDVIHQRYWLGLLPGEIAEARGENVTEVNRLEHMAIKELRHPKRKDRLREFHRFDCYRGTGLKAYRSRGASVQEQYIMWKGITPRRKKERDTLPPRPPSPGAEEIPSPVNMPSRNFEILKSLDE